MSDVRLTGQLVCKNCEERDLVVQNLPQHVKLTRAEPGCLAFEVTQTIDPLVWRVEEHFEGEEVFRAHQARVASSEWGRITSLIERRYVVEGLSR
ncbi:putative quinol monooxygenase [Clavibacter phaseoli]|uniref:putative quinol monooxygenase n=1 Tax=Clavibacter phaseoli TaxID=1734031 RepID=UPI001F1DF1BA|nr:antibiotic biosynthesis monooxygenase [Clavibacter phaseoli]UKF32495.1 antibiotic biosynthesis monooxygenase [Clavibacter phaseoli]UKF38484.1 antibiotic biosynthesis monooxygenase [Clavibacter phaseoli]